MIGAFWMMKPPRLQVGDRIAAVTLSWGGPGEFPHRYEAGKRQLQECFGVELVEMEHTLAEPAHVAADPAARAADLHAAFADPQIDGIVSSIGGDDSIRLLPHLDLELIAAYPKVFLGYSDSTIIQMALLRAGLVSFYGPAVMAGFAENTGLHDYLVEGVRRTLFEPQPQLEWPPNTDGWTVEMLDWSVPDTQSQARTLNPATPWRWHGGRAREGHTVVGCLEVLDWLRGSEWWPRLAGAVLFIETSEEAPSADVVARFLRALALTGQLQGLEGIVVGRPGGADLPISKHTDYDEAVLQVLRNEQGLVELPIVTNVDFGHTDPMWTVPQGIRLRIDPAAERLTFLEAAVK